MSHAHGPLVFIDAFPIHYARFQSYFTKCALKRAEMPNAFRSQIITRLAEHMSFAHEIERVVERTGAMKDVMEGLRATILSASRTGTANTAEANAEALSTQFQSLARAMKGLREVFSVVDGITGQTNLLALNATIEAARAGEAAGGSRWSPPR
ncbi:methyl-accepting chemotaxis protein [Xanthobacter sp. V4C-4]